MQDQQLSACSAPVTILTQNVEEPLCGTRLKLHSSSLLHALTFIEHYHLETQQATGEDLPPIKMGHAMDYSIMLLLEEICQEDGQSIYDLLTDHRMCIVKSAD